MTVTDEMPLHTAGPAPGGFGVICRRMYCARIARVGGCQSFGNVEQDVANRGRMYYRKCSELAWIIEEVLLLLGHF